MRRPIVAGVIISNGSPSSAAQTSSTLPTLFVPISNLIRGSLVASLLYRLPPPCPPPAGGGKKGLPCNICFFHVDLPRFRAVGRSDEPLAFHDVEELRRPCIADAQPAL